AHLQATGTDGQHLAGLSVQLEWPGGREILIRLGIKNRKPRYRPGLFCAVLRSLYSPVRPTPTTGRFILQAIGARTIAVPKPKHPSLPSAGGGNHPARVLERAALAMR